MKKKKNNKLFRLILLSLFIVYIGLYIANETGYYESKLNNKVRLTNESIIQFEKDVEDGKNVTIEDYLKDETVDYSNKVSKLGLKFSKTTEDFMSDGLSKIFKVLGKLFS